MPRKITLYRPGRGFRTVSVTGRSCALQCEHCRGRYLCSMADVSAKGSLVTFGQEAICRGVKGLLISGGCTPNGSVPLTDRIEEVRELKRMGLVLNIHTGLLDGPSVEAVVSTGADSYSVDIHASGNVIREVLHLDGDSEDYERTLALLCSKAPGKVSPHICAGLDGDSIQNETVAVDMCARKNISSLILLRHVRTKGAPHDPRPPMSDGTFLKLVEYAVRTSKAPIMLGCMRPRPSADLEVGCAELGVSGIASPSSSTKRRLEALGYEIAESELCCAVHL